MVFSGIRVWQGRRSILVRKSIRLFRRAFVLQMQIFYYKNIKIAMIMREMKTKVINGYVSGKE
jgi:hypothetical protein